MEINSNGKSASVSRYLSFSGSEYLLVGDIICNLFQSHPAIQYFIPFWLTHSII